MDLPPETLAQLERLAASGIRLLPIVDLPRHFVFECDEFVALVENVDGRFGGVGSPGLMTERGFAPLIQRPAGPAFVCKDYELPATPDQAARAHAFFTLLLRAFR